MSKARYDKLTPSTKRILERMRDEGALLVRGVLSRKTYLVARNEPADRGNRLTLSYAAFSLLRDYCGAPEIQEHRSVYRLAPNVEITDEWRLAKFAKSKSDAAAKQEAEARQQATLDEARVERYAALVSLFGIAPTSLNEHGVYFTYQGVGYVLTEQRG